MSIMGMIVAQEMQWFAVRVKRHAAGSIRTATVGGEFEAYRDRKGRVRQRRIKDTGSRVFVPELLLRRAGFEVFMPIKKVWRKKNRFSPENHRVSQPLLVDWMFVGWPVGEARWHDLMALDAVHGVLGSGGQPVAISPAQIMGLMRRWGGGELSPECARYMKVGQEISVGDVARIVDGPFEGREVRVLNLNGPSVKALMTILGGDIEADIRSDVLEVVKR